MMMRMETSQMSAAVRILSGGGVLNTDAVVQPFDESFQEFHAVPSGWFTRELSSPAVSRSRALAGSSPSAR